MKCKEILRKSKRKIMIMAFTLGATTTLHAASYGYGVKCNSGSTSGHTYATDDSCDVETVSRYTRDGKSIIQLGADYAVKDPATGYATVSRRLPTGGLYFTRVDGTHHVGNNEYTSLDVYTP